MSAAQAPVHTHPQDAVVDLLGVLLRAQPDGLHKALDTVLARLARITGSDRAFLLLLEGDSWSCPQDWAAPGLAPLGERLQRVPRAGLEPMIDTLLAHQPLTPPATPDLPPGRLREILSGLDIGRFLGVPFLGADDLAGMIGLARTAPHPGFGPADLDLVTMLSEAVNATMSRMRTMAELIRMREEQARTLDRLRATLAAMPELLLEIDADGVCTDWHCAAPDQLMARPEGVLGRKLEETLPPDIAALQRAAMAEALANGVARAPVYALETGGQRRWFRLTVARRDAPGTGNASAGFVFRIRDITDEHARATETALLGEVTRRMTNMAIILDPDARVVWVNPAFEARSGYTLGELQGKRASDLPKAPETDDDTLARIEAALAARRPVRAELAKRDRRGQLYWVDMTLQPLTGPDGAHQGFVAIETETTERQRHLADLERLARDAETAHARLQDAIEALQDAFVLFDRDDRLVMCNRRYREINAAIDDVLVPGVTYAQIVQAGVARGLYLSNPGLDAFCTAVARGEPIGHFRGEIPYANGRIYRTFSSRTSDGGRVGLRSDITEIRRAEARLEDIIRSARIGTWELDLEQGRVRLGGRWPRLQGLPDTSAGPITEFDVAVSDWFAILHPDDRAPMTLALDQLRETTGDSTQTECRLRHADGSWIHVLLRGRVNARDDSGGARRLSGISVDITRRREAEERLTEILTAARVGTWTLDTRTGSVTIDAPYAAMLGYSVAELMPMTRERFESLLHPDDLSQVHGNVAQLYGGTADSVAHEFRMRHRDGRWIWVLSKARVLGWAAPGVPVAESGIHLDITESKESAAALARAMTDLERANADRDAAEQRLADIAAVSTDWFWETDPAGRFTFVSDGFTRTTGLPADLLLGRTLIEAGLEPLSPAAATTAAREHIFRLSRAAGSDPLWLRLSGAPFTEAARSGFRGVGSDVSQLIRATETAQAANRAKSQFLANMSHELRTPLTGVLGMAELLADSLADPEQRRMLDSIRASGEGLLAILNDVLDLAKIEAGKLEINALPFSPADLADRLRALFAEPARLKGLSLDISLAPCAAALLSGDANRILQILTNLVGNAIKFTDTGHVSCRFEPGGTGGLRVVVTDTGIGMSAEQAARVFDEFEQAEGSTARRYGGTGLGLSITRRLVSLMEGMIDLDSTPGAGTRVCVDLPLGPAQQVPAVPAPDPLPLPPGLRVLVADDNATNRHILKTMLGALGLQVTMASDGTEALNLFHCGGFDALLLDISMPGLDGIDALAAIRAAEARAGVPAVPALAVSANAMDHQVREYLDAGFAGHVAKPFRKATLAHALSTLLAQGCSAAQ